MDTGMGPHLSRLLERHGSRWQIGQDPATGVWVAVERPSPTALNVHVRHTLAELDVALDGDKG